MPDSLTPEIDKGLIRLCFLVAVVLISVNLLFVLFPEEVTRTKTLEEPVRTLVRQLDLGREENVATWCTSTFLLLNALLAYSLRRQFRDSDPTTSRYLGVLSLGFCLLSIDDLAQLHEEVEDVLEDGLEATSLSDDYLGLGFGSVLACLLLLLTYRGLRRYLGRVDKIFLAGSILCVALAVVAEGLETFFGCRRASVCARLEVVAEEGGELFAILLFLTLQYRVLAHQQQKEDRV